MPKVAYDGTIFDSEDELELFWWLEEAQSVGLIASFEYQQPTWVLADPVIEEVARIGKRGQPIKPTTRTVLRGASYTCDFRIWSIYEALPIHEYVDVKPKYSRRHSDAKKFEVIRKWVYQRHGVLVHPLAPYKLFERTWAPEKAKVTKVKKDPRKGYCELPTVATFMQRLCNAS